MIASWIDNMPEDVYHADPCEEPSLSSSIANVLLTRSPWHAWRIHPKLGGKRDDEVTASTDMGNVVHALVLGCGAKYTVVEASNFRTKQVRVERDAARTNGRIPILRTRFDEAQATANEVRLALAQQGIKLDGKSERVAIWEEMGRRGPVLCRARMDHICADGTIIDIKTAADATDAALVRSCLRYGYHVQRAAYLSAMGAIKPDSIGRTKFVLVFVEVGTNAVVPKILSGALATIGESRWQRAVDAWSVCRATGRWPGLADGVGQLSAPDWALVADIEDATVLRDRMNQPRTNGGNRE